MALIRYGAIIQAASGNLAGVNFVSSARGPVARKARAPRAARSAAQLQVHASMKALSDAWAALSSFDQDLWRTAAASISSHTRLGLPKTLNGRQFFFRHNLPPRAFDPTFLETDPPNIEQTVGPTEFIITIPVAFLWTLTYTAFPLSGTTQMRLYAFRPYTSGPAVHASSWTPVLMSTPIASGTPIRPDTDAAVGPLEVNDLIQFKLIFRTNGLLDSIPQFASAFG